MVYLGKYGPPIVRVALIWTAIRLRKCLVRSENSMRLLHPPGVGHHGTQQLKVEDLECSK